MGGSSRMGILAPFAQSLRITHGGEGRLRLGYPEKAAECLGRALAVWPTPYQRERGPYLSRAAVAQLASEQPDEAATTALKALELAEATGSARVKREVALLGQRLTPFRNQPAPAALLDALAVPASSGS